MVAEGKGSRGRPGRGFLPRGGEAHRTACRRAVIGNENCPSPVGVKVRRGAGPRHALSPTVEVQQGFGPLMRHWGRGKGRGGGSSWRCLPPHPFPLPHWSQA